MEKTRPRTPPSVFTVTFEIGVGFRGDIVSDCMNEANN